MQRDSKTRVLHTVQSKCAVVEKLCEPLFLVLTVKLWSQVQYDYVTTTIQGGYLLFLPERHQM